jgi:hypothetical protein
MMHDVLMANDGVQMTQRMLHRTYRWEYRP